MALHRQAGLSLVELMISIAISLTILASASTFYIASVRSSSTTLKASKLNQELMALLSVMSSEIRRSGYSAQADLESDPHLNIFNTMDVTALTVRSSVASPTTTATAGQCILFAYDRDEDGSLDNNEILGFRLNNSVVQMRLAGDTAANSRHDDCDDADDTWQDLTDRRLIRITNLSFDSAGSACINLREPDGNDNDGDGTDDNPEEADCYDSSNIPTAGGGDLTVEAREINITLAGQLVGDANVTSDIDYNVVIRNDLVRVR